MRNIKWFVEVKRNDNPEKFIYCKTPEEAAEKACLYPDGIAWERKVWNDGAISYRRFFKSTGEWKCQ